MFTALFFAVYGAIVCSPVLLMVAIGRGLDNLQCA